MLIMPEPLMRKTIHSMRGIPATKPRSTIPHEFVLDALARLSPWTRPMFGCLAVYVGEKIVLILRQKPSYERDNGVWLATTEEHHATLREEFPNMRSIGVLGKEVTGWQVLPVDSPGFEESALRACDLLIAGDARIGKIPGKKRRPATRTETSSPKRKASDWITTSAPRRARVNLAVQTDQDSEGKEPSMLIIGCDFHSRFQQIAMVDTETGDLRA